MMALNFQKMYGLVGGLFEKSINKRDAYKKGKIQSIMGISGKRVREDLCEEIIFNLRQRMTKSYQAKGTDKSLGEEM